MILPREIRSRRGNVPITYRAYRPFAHRADGRPRSLYGEARVGDGARIWINRETRPRTQLATILHEYLHVRFPEASEAQVRAMERATRDVLETVLKDNGVL